jgi:hypothetical protein
MLCGECGEYCKDHTEIDRLTRERDEWQAKALEYLGVIQELRVILNLVYGNIQKGRTLLRGKEEE